MIENLTKVVRDRTRSIDERRVALEEIRAKATSNEDANETLATLANEFPELAGLMTDAPVDVAASDEGDSLSTDAREMLMVLKLKPLALFKVSIEQLDRYCKHRHITGERYDALYDEWRDYQLPSDEWLRLLHLADPATDIHWAWLAHWRNVLAAPKKRLVKLFAEQNIKMLSEYALVPAAVREGAGKFLAEYRQLKEGQPVPRISIPGNEHWLTMSHGDLYKRMERVRELQVA